jgi:hypothetical protein
VTFRGLLETRDPEQALPDLLVPTAGLLQAVRVSFPGNEGGTFGPEALVTARTEHDFSCLVPFARYIVCGADSQLVLAEEASLPNQGAPYAYEGPPLLAAGGATP